MQPIKINRKENGTFKKKNRFKRFLIKTFILAGVVAACTIAINYYFPRTSIVFQDRTITQQVVVKDTTLSPILTKIASCESGGKQFRANGDVTRGKINPSDIGEFQINEPIWNDKARKLGYDIYTQEGNEGMARFIFENVGTSPWSSSAKCWVNK